MTEPADRQLGQNCDEGDCQRVVLTDDGGCRGGGGDENVGGLLMNMAEDKGDVKPSDDMSEQVIVVRLDRLVDISNI